MLLTDMDDAFLDVSRCSTLLAATLLTFLHTYRVKTSRDRAASKMLARKKPCARRMNKRKRKWKYNNSGFVVIGAAR